MLSLIPTVAQISILNLPVFMAVFPLIHGIQFVFFNGNVRFSLETRLENANSHLKRFDADFDELEGSLRGYARQGLSDKEEISCRAENTTKPIGASTTMS